MRQLSILRRRPLVACVLWSAFGCGSSPGSATPDTAATSAAHDTECGSQGCLDGVRINVVAAAATFDAGNYVVTFELGATSETCGFEVLGGFDACGAEQTCAGASDCDAGFGLAGPAHSVSFFVEAVAGPDTEGAATGSGSLPQLLGVEVRKDADVVFADMLLLDYDDVTPNGPSCEPRCRVAQASVPIAPAR